MKPSRKQLIRARMVNSILVVVLVFFPMTNSLASLCHNVSSPNQQHTHTALDTADALSFLGIADIMPADADVAGEQGHDAHSVNCMSCSSIPVSVNIFKQSFQNESPRVSFADYHPVSLPVDKRPPKFS